MPKPLDDLLLCIDRRKLDQFMQHYVRDLVERGLDKWDDDARWKTLLTRMGGNAAEEFAVILARQMANDFLPKEQE